MNGFYSTFLLSIVKGPINYFKIILLRNNINVIMSKTLFFYESQSYPSPTPHIVEYFQLLVAIQKFYIKLNMKISKPKINKIWDKTEFKCVR